MRFLRFALLTILTGSLGTPGLRASPPPSRLTPQALDTLLDRSVPGPATGKPLPDELFLRRATLDLTGRPPTPEERTAFLQDTSVDKRARVIDRLLQSQDYGRNWANYWSDTIRYRVPPPELTFLNYTAFKGWLAGKLNADTPWDEITRNLLTASGKLQDNPAAMFVGFHQGNAAKLSAETARIFLGLQLQCAECHNHKFDHWKRKQFHQLAAFFARTEAKLTQKDSGGTVVKDRGKGEYEMPNKTDPRKKGTVIAPVFLTGEGLDLGASDADRRTFLARIVTRPDNPWFARAYVNRLWARLMGRGFYEPVDNMADYQQHLLPELHQALADHFTASGFDTKDLCRLLMNTRAYQRWLPLGERLGDKPVVALTPTKLRGDEVFDSLVLALGLPNLTPPAVKPTAAIRFPAPPQSTRDLVAEKFGMDPSVCPEEVSRTMAQAMQLMNNAQIQAQINADPKSGTLLAKLLQQETDNRAVVVRLYQQVLARRPTDAEVQIALEHVATVGQRGAAFEDLLWSLVNTAEFTTKR
jgi:hypothetical protein